MLLPYCPVTFDVKYPSMATTTQSTSSAGPIAERLVWYRELPKALPNHQIILIFTAIVAIVIDQATKWWVEANIVLHTLWAPFPAYAHIFDFLHVKNPGAAFGTGQQLGWLFSIIAFVVCGFMEQNFIILLILCKVPAIQSEQMVKQLAHLDQNNQNTYLIDRITTVLQILL